MADKKAKTKQNLVIALVAYLFLLYMAVYFLSTRNICPEGTSVLEVFILMSNRIALNPFAIGHAFDDLIFAMQVIGALSAAYLVAALYIWSESESKKHEDSRTAKGSASFNQDYKGFNEKYSLKKPTKAPGDPDPNIILGKGLYYGLKEGRNTNVMIIGSAGSGKSFGVIKPNLMQLNTSYVITDPSGEMFQAEAKLLLEEGYVVKIFSTSDMVFSNCYNPFDYCYDESGEIDENRVSTMINLFLQNAADLKNNRGDPFWEKSSRALLQACAMLLLEFFPEEYRNMREMLILVQKGRVSEDKNAAQTELDKIFSAAKEMNKEAHCFTSYNTFKLAPARTANSILISAAVDLNNFNQDKVRNMTTTSYLIKSRNTRGHIREYFRDKDGKLIRTDDNIDLRTLGEQKTCLFINIPQANNTYNFLVSMLYAQLFETQYGRAEKIYPTKYLVTDKYGNSIISMLESEEDAEQGVGLYRDAEIISKNVNGKKMYFFYNRDADRKFCLPGYGRGILKRVYSPEAGKKFQQKLDGCKIVHGKNHLPVHLQCLLDEFANIGQIPEFPEKLATMRKYEISCMIVLQSLSPIKERYDKRWNDILSNCDSTIFLGSTDPDTCKYISQDRLGKRTIRIRNNSRSHSGKGRNSSTSYQLDARDLATPDEVSRLDHAYSYVMVSGELPFQAKKYKASDHPNWKRTGDVDPKMRMFPGELAVCSEKKDSKGEDTEAMIMLINYIPVSENGRVKTVSIPQKKKDMNESTAENGPAKPVEEKVPNDARRDYQDEFMVNDNDVTDFLSSLGDSDHYSGSSYTGNVSRPGGGRKSV